LTPSQLYVFMPPNLGGFFMVRSYYPSECHADYFDFERIEALKPAIEACGISTLSQSPMLGFHKQMDNRIKLLEEILSFRMQGVEFDNGDMYVDGHKAASDVRDEFVSVTEKLMDELAQCYNVLPQLDINNTIDHRPEGDEKWFLENEKTVTQFCRKLAAERPLKDIRDEYNYPKKKGIKDECSRLLEASTMKSRRGFAIQRLMNAMRQAHADGWFFRSEGDEKWFLENEKTVTQFCRKLAAERPLKDIRDEYNYPKKKGIKDECSRLLEASTMKSRRGFAIQRLMNAMRQAHADGWFI